MSGRGSKPAYRRLPQRVTENPGDRECGVFLLNSVYSVADFSLGRGGALAGKARRAVCARRAWRTSRVAGARARSPAPRACRARVLPSTRDASSVNTSCIAKQRFGLATVLPFTGLGHERSRGGGMAQPPPSKPISLITPSSTQAWHAEFVAAERVKAVRAVVGRPVAARVVPRRAVVVEDDFFVKLAQVVHVESLIRRGSGLLPLQFVGTCTEITSILNNDRRGLWDKFSLSPKASRPSVSNHGFRVPR